MLNDTIHLGSATPFSCRAGPRAPARRARLSAPALLSLPPGPARQRPASLCPNSDTPPARATSGSRPVGTRSGRHPPVRARPQDRPRAAWHLTAGPPYSPLLFPSLPRRRPSRSNVTEPLVHFPVTNSSPAPSQAPPPSPLLLCPYRYLRPPEASPSRQILLSAAAIFPLSGERPPSFAIPKLELTLSSPSAPVLQDPSPVVAAHRSSLPASERRCPEPLFHRPVVRVRATPARLARRHPEESLVLSGCTSPPVSHRRAIGKHVTAPSHTR
jgi:hypothetical protein